jgi:hypothetical protein
MDDTGCQKFFLHPTYVLQRKYEALRAFFVEHRSLKEIATQLGYSYGSVRSFVWAFRSQCATGQLPPFLPPPCWDDLLLIQPAPV